MRNTTKRSILSQIAKLFDPQGCIGPVIVTAKVIMQRTWKAKPGELDWDKAVPDDIAKDWMRYQAQLPALVNIRIPRWLGIGPGSCFSLHGFADASELAYGAVVYVRVERVTETKCMLLSSRSRVATAKLVTTPRLELSAADLLGELMQAVKGACGFDFIRTSCWTDSSIVLNWMSKDPDTLKLFVHNRIQRIRESTADCEWRHVSSQDNPADLLSRGVAPAELQANKKWWHGPNWLAQPSQELPVSQPKLTIQMSRSMEAEMKSSWLDQAEGKT